MELLEVRTVMTGGTAVSRPCTVTVERRPCLRAAAAVFAEIRQTSAKKEKETNKQSIK